MAALSSGPLNLFYSYAHEDEVWRHRLETHLSILKRQKAIIDWHERDISAGTVWEDEMNIHLDMAHVILLLVSPDFMASNYCYGKDMERAMARHCAKEARIIPILLRPTDLEGTPLEQLQSLPKDGRFVTLWQNIDEALLDIAQGIRHVIEELTSFPVHTSSFASSVFQQPMSLWPILWHVPHQLNPLFTGREDLLQKLHDTLFSAKTTDLTQPLALSGLGGIGKTQIALQYAYHYRHEYQYILWVSGATEETLRSDLIQLADPLHLPSHETSDQKTPPGNAQEVSAYSTQEQVIKHVRDRLEQHSNWLLIIDNVNDLKMIHAYILSGYRMHGHLLFTTQRHPSVTLTRLTYVEPMNKDEGALLLLRRAELLQPDATLEQARKTDRDQAQALVEALGGLPLAIDQAGAYIEEVEVGLADYLSLYKQWRRDLLQRRGRHATEHPESVTTTVLLSFQQVEHANPAAADLLRLCALVGPNPIPEEIFKVVPFLSKRLRPVLADSLLFNEAIGTLRQFSLVRRSPEEKLLNVHQLVQNVVCDTMTLSEYRHWVKLVILMINAAFPQQVEKQTWEQCQRYLAPALVCAEYITNHKPAFLKQADNLLHRIARYLYDQGAYDQAEVLYQHSLDIEKRRSGPEHLNVADILQDSAELCYAQKQYAKAEQLYERTLALRKERLGSEHPKTNHTLQCLAQLYWTQGRSEEAEFLYLQALTIEEKMLGTEHPDLCAFLYQLVMIYRYQGNYSEAEHFCRRALLINKTGTALGMLAGLYCDQGCHKEAESLYQQALAIKEKMFGLEHPDLCMVLNNLAQIYRRQHRYEEAESLLQRALSISEKMSEPNHPDRGTLLHSLAQLYHVQGQYRETEPLYLRALALKEETLGPEHLDTSSTLHSLAQLYHIQGQYREAEPLYLRALAIREKILSAEHKLTALTQKHYTNLLQNQREQGKEENVVK